MTGGVRDAEPADLAQLPEVEAAADSLFASLGVLDLPPPRTPAERAAARRVLVTGRPVAGAVLERVGGAVHHEAAAGLTAHGRRIAMARPL